MGFVVAPAVLAWVAIGTAAASSAVAAYSSISSGNAQKRIQEYNASLSRVQAADARERGAIEESKVLASGTAQVAEARVGASGAGVDVQSESVLDAIEQTRFMSKWSALGARSNALREAAGYERQAFNQELQGSAAATAGAWNAVGQGLGGASRMFSAGYDTGLLPKFSRAGDGFSMADAFVE